MPLSDHEQRLLEQMEQALYAEDPRFASVLQGEDMRVRHRRRLALAVIGFVLGVVLLMAGLVFLSGNTAVMLAVSVVGFGVMLVSVLAGVQAVRRGPAEGGQLPSARPSNVTPLAAARRRRGFMEKVEERWQRRRDETGR